MCGISGYLGQKNIDLTEIKNTLSLMKQRGPDDQSYYHPLNTDLLKVLFLHSRLSIIDLNTRSNQPFSIGGYTIIFNGEIYNYIELKKALIEKGIKFNTDSDTEVLLQSFIEEGPSCVNKFEGMWSFAIWDNKNFKLYLSRDRFGEKPLYYTLSDDGIYFGSEIKFLKSLSNIRFKVNHKHLLNYLTLGYKSLYKEERTFFEDILEIPKASIVEITKNPNDKLKIKTNYYWQPKTQNLKISLDESIERAKYLLIESLKIRLRSDVPLAFCLSGGVDSAALVSIASKVFNFNVNTFSIIEEDLRYDERENILATIKDTGCKSNLIKIPQNGNLEGIKNLVSYHDAPIATTTYYVHSLLSEQISKNGFRVAFSGTAADEIFTGYYDHFLLYLYEIRNTLSFSEALGKWEQHVSNFIRNPILKKFDLYIENPSYRDHVYDNFSEFHSWLSKDAKSLIDPSFKENSYSDSLLKNRMLNELLNEITPVILHEDDLNSMCYSIENRSPYLDTNLIEFMYSIPAEHYIQDGYGKFILRESVKGILNDKVRLDRQKKGFNASINSLVNFKDKKVVDELLEESNQIFDLINREQVIKLFSEEQLPNHYSKFLFSFINSVFFLNEHNT